MVVIKPSPDRRVGAVRSTSRLTAVHATGGSGWMVYAQVDPRMDPLRSDPRFVVLLPRVAPAG